MLHFWINHKTILSGWVALTILYSLVEILTVATTNAALFPKKVNMPKTVQTQTIEHSLFAVHKNPHFTSYVRVSYMHATFGVMNVGPNNILYQTLFVNCVSQTNVLQTVVQRWSAISLKQWHTQSVESESVARVNVQSPSCDATSHFERNSVLISSPD